MVKAPEYFYNSSTKKTIPKNLEISGKPAGWNQKKSWVNSGCRSETVGGKRYENHDYRQ
jgi:hypothetical protein